MRTLLITSRPCISAVHELGKVLVLDLFSRISQDHAEGVAEAREIAVMIRLIDAVPSLLNEGPQSVVGPIPGLRGGIPDPALWFRPRFVVPFHCHITFLGSFSLWT